MHMHHAGHNRKLVDTSVTQVLYGALVGGPGNTSDYSGELTQLEFILLAIAGCACIEVPPLHRRVPCKFQCAAQPALVGARLRPNRLSSAAC